MVLLTRKVLLSLSVGILFAALFHANFRPVETVALIWEAFKGVFVDGGAINTWNVYILIFILMLGVITALVSMAGGTKAFGDWMVRRVKTRVGAQLMTIVFGMIVFVDDYFNSLAVGQVARPLTDRHRISRAKLAYIVDSTAAPVCVIAPVSSWGAYIIGLIGTVLTTVGVTGINPLESFVEMIPMNFYVWAAFGLVFIIAVTGRDFGPMKAHEQRAVHTGIVTVEEGKGKETKLPVNQSGKIRHLLIPIIVLFLSTVVFLYVNGMQTVGGTADFIQIFGSADVSVVLLYGGLLTVFVTSILFFAGTKDIALTGKHFLTGVREGMKSMLPAISILLFAWMITFLIDRLETGTYLANVIERSDLSPLFLPFIVFITAGFIAFATGTSWGSFALLLPIAGTIAANSEPSLLMPMMAAVLAGAVFGDHCSPISDTTILSSTGANCHHIDHVTTQLPYAMTSAAIAGIGYLILGVSGNIWIGLVTVLILLIAVFLILKWKADSPDGNPLNGK